MSKKREQPQPKSNASPVNGVVPPPEHRWKPGQSGNPKGRKTAGAYVTEWWNILASQELTEQELRTIARDKRNPWAKRTAAERMLRTLEAGDLADFEPLLKGEMTLDQLREKGVNTEVVKKVKRRIRTTKDGETEEENEVELHDRAGADVDRVLDRTEGRPKQTVDLNQNGTISIADGEARADAILARLRERLGVTNSN